MKLPRKTKFIFVTGGVVSALGKGIASASMALILKQRGLNVTIQKFDPYINVDPGTMNPYQHGEVYVTDDGAETDLDLGHYERFIDLSLSSVNTTTAGQVYFDVIQKERKGEFLGSTVQVIPHITDEIKKHIIAPVLKNKDLDVVFTEVGGTVGDIESLPFLEAIRQFCLENGQTKSMIVHLTLVPYIPSSQELKTKPTQHSVMRLREIGLLPDMLLCRSDRPLDDGIKAKIGLFCNVHPHHVIEARDVSTIYEVPLALNEQKIGDLICKRLKLRAPDVELKEWKKLVSNIKNPGGEVEIAICGKYTQLPDAYKSIIESFIHSGVQNNVKVNIRWVDSEKVNRNNAETKFKGIHGILVPGGFGDRGIEGMIEAIRHARINNIPFFGICLGLQTAVIEFARNVCELIKANSTEFKPKVKFNVIDLIPEQREIVDKGATMRLGEYPCVLKEGTKAFKAYKEIVIKERHRHRLEVNNEFKPVLAKNGMMFAGLSPDEKLVEMIELKDHPWFVGCQFHPELKSRAVRAHPLFREFVKASKHYKAGINGKTDNKAASKKAKADVK